MFASDQHAGSSVGLLHPDGVSNDDGEWINPSRVQRWLWDKHEQFISDVDAIIADEPGASTHYFNVGDLTEGRHHNTHQLVSPDEGVHIQAATDLLSKGVLRLGFDSVHMLRGTPAHVKQAAGLEKAVANRLNAQGFPIVRDPENDSFLWRKLYAEFDGVLFDVRHHGRTGMYERTRGSYSKLYAQEIWETHVVTKRRPPDIAVRGHKHKKADSGPDPNGKTRAIQLPCWQLPTEWVGSRAIESLPDIGGLVIIVKGGRAHVEFLTYQPDPDPQPIWRP